MPAWFTEVIIARHLAKKEGLDAFGGIWNRQGRRYIVFDVDATRQAARQRALPTDPTLPSSRCRLDVVCAHGCTGRKRGEAVRIRTVALQMHTRQWIGTTCAGRGNGDYQIEVVRVRLRTRVLVAVPHPGRDERRILVCEVFPGVMGSI